MDGHALVGRGSGGAYGEDPFNITAGSERARQGNQDARRITTAKRSAIGTTATPP